MGTTVLRGEAVGMRSEVVVSKGRSSLDPSCTVVELRGDFDAAALHRLVDVLDAALERDGADVVVDLANVGFIGAGWIGTLVRRRAMLETQNRELTLRSAPNVVRRLFELCGLAYLLEPASPRRRGPARPIVPN